MSQCRITSYDLSCIVNGNRIDIGTDESPSIFRLTDNGIDAVGTYTDIQAPVLTGIWDSCFQPCRFIGYIRLNQICYVMDIISSPGNGWAQIILGNIPVSYAVVTYQEGFVECLYCPGIKEIDACCSISVQYDELF